MGLRLFLIVAALASASLVAAQDDPTMSLHGFRVFVRGDLDPVAARDITDRLAYDTAFLQLSVPPATYRLLATARIYVTDAGSPTGSVVYHRSAQWLQDHGKDPAMVHGIEIVNGANYRRVSASNQPMVLLHELAHFYMDTVLGEADPDIHGAYARAVSSGRYDLVGHLPSGYRRAYALTDAWEFFAESSEAYFGTNDYFPYRRCDLAAWDPATWLLMEQTWTWTVREPVGLVAPP